MQSIKKISFGVGLAILVVDQLIAKKNRSLNKTNKSGNTIEFCPQPETYDFCSQPKTYGFCSQPKTYGFCSQPETSSGDIWY